MLSMIFRGGTTGVAIAILATLVQFVFTYKKLSEGENENEENEKNEDNSEDEQVLSKELRSRLRASKSLSGPSVVPEKNRHNVEVCCSDINSVLQSAAGGCDSVELCVDRACGGVSPGPGLVESAVLALRGSNVRVNVLVRPRAGHFRYSHVELEQMFREVLFARECGAHGVVVGCLTDENLVDEASLSIMRTLAGPHMTLTFHRAIDTLISLDHDEDDGDDEKNHDEGDKSKEHKYRREKLRREKSSREFGDSENDGGEKSVSRSRKERVRGVVESLVRCGVDRVLTSGGAACAGSKRGLRGLRLLSEASAGRLSLVAGGGLDLSSAGDAADEAGVSGIHLGSAVHRLRSRDVNRGKGGESDDGRARMGSSSDEDLEQWQEVDAELVRGFVTLLYNSEAWRNSDIVNDNMKKKEENENKKEKESETKEDREEDVSEFSIHSSPGGSLRSGRSGNVSKMSDSASNREGSYIVIPNKK